ncbi:MAG: hypothetical protein J6A75_03475 [Lachnospiraceae bacterium]|nr:hypothetical protein [Lachnospiraceae bacterium]
MNEPTNLATTIDSAGSTSGMYDKLMKELLADKQVLARILKNTMNEFKDMEIPNIIQCLGSVHIQEQRVEPGLSNLGKVERTATENSAQGEGTIYYDIRFSAYVKNRTVKILINVEAQKSIKASQLKYHIVNRIVFYLARMISAEKEVEFFNSDYDNIKKVASIWICMSDNEKDGSIEKLSLSSDEVYGESTGLLSTDLMEGYLICLRKSDNVKASKNELISMLEDLINGKDAEEKKRNLETKHNMIMSEEFEGRLSQMCNLSGLVLEEGMEKERENGLKALIATIKELSPGICVEDVYKLVIKNETYKDVTPERIKKYL